MSDPRIGKHKLVRITYTIRDQAGQILEHSSLPVSYVHGTGSALFEAIEHALEGRAVGDEVTVTLPPEKGFGRHRPELTYTDDVGNVPEPLRRLGAEAEFENERGERKQFVVSKIENGLLTVDGNHPFAGKTVTFTVRVAAVREATAEELATGVAGLGKPFD